MQDAVTGAHARVPTLLYSKKGRARPGAVQQQQCHSRSQASQSREIIDAASLGETPARQSNMVMLRIGLPKLVQRILASMYVDFTPRHWSVL